MYCSYLDYVRPIELLEKRDDNVEAVRLLKEKLELMEADYESCKFVCAMYLEKEEKYQAAIEELTKKNNDLQEQLTEQRY